MLGIKPRAFYMLGKYSIYWVHAPPHVEFKQKDVHIFEFRHYCIRHSMTRQILMIEIFHPGNQGPPVAVFAMWLRD